MILIRFQNQQPSCELTRYIKKTIYYFGSGCGEPSLQARRSQNKPEIPIASNHYQFDLVIPVHHENWDF